MNGYLGALRVFVWEKRLLLLMLFVCALYFASINTALYTWGDNAHYIIVGKSLSTGNGFRDIHLPEAPPFTFPVPMLPLLLAPIIFLFDYDLLPMKILEAVMGVVAVYVLYLLFKDYVSEAEAILLALLAGVSPQLVSFSHQVMTETPYLLLSGLSLLCMRKYASEEEWFTRAGLLTSLVLAATCLTRSIGISLVLASVLYLLINFPKMRSTNLKKSCLLVSSVAAVWVLFNYPILWNITYVRELSTASNYSSNAKAASFGDLYARILDNARSYWTVIPEVIWYRAYRHPFWLFSVFSFALIGCGYIRSLLESRTTLEYYIPLYACILLLYEPSNVGNVQRYVVPVIPFLLYYFARGAKVVALGIGAILARIRPPAPGPASLTAMRATRVALMLFYVLPIVTLTALNFRDTVRASVLESQPEMFDFYRFDSWTEFKKMALWAKEHTPPESVIMTRWVYFFHFWSRRTVVWYPPLDSREGGEHMVSTLLEANADYIAVDSLTVDRVFLDKTLLPALRERAGELELVYQDGDNRLFRIRHR
jgi:4-amino-4-deoxy-L-arabinose transferase-like glycosyltransferase